MLKSVLQPFPVGVRFRRHRRVFSPHLDLFRAVKKIQKFPSEVETLPVLYKTYSKILRISVFNLYFRPFLVGVRLWCSIPVFASVWDLFRSVKKTRKFQSEVELLHVLYLIHATTVRISSYLFTLIFDHWWDKVDSQGLKKEVQIILEYISNKSRTTSVPVGVYKFSQGFDRIER